MKERYLIDVDLRPVPVLAPDVLVVGSGVAGLSAAIAAAGAGASVTVLAKGDADDSNTAHAQGGVAAALAPDDGPEAHLRDTVEAGAGLTDEAVARRVVTEGPSRVRELIEWGARFDRLPGGGIAFTREGGHSHDRILHAHGDATGREIARVLVERAGADPNIMLMPGHYVVDLLHADGRVHGALALTNGGSGDPSRRGAPAMSALQTAGLQRAGIEERAVGARGLDTLVRRNVVRRKLVRIEPGATVLATGGAGRLFRETTNPDCATGDGVALAFRAGAELADLEFVQFHPTTLYVAGARRLLISEAVRGEGAHLLNTRRERFMEGVHPMAELAPRDVVSAAIVEEMARTESPHVYLDLRHLDAARVKKRFPLITGTCADYSLDVTRDLIPVRPAAHYMMGGVVTASDGRTSVPGLFAAGEVACTGLHGANRLASNSLLEGLVFGEAAGRAAAKAEGPGPFPEKRLSRMLPPRDVPVDLDDMRLSLQALMNRAAGVFRNRADLESALRSLGYWKAYMLPIRLTAPEGFVLQNMLTTATLIVRGAVMREESRGAHRRRDFPERDDAAWRRRIVQSVKDFEE